MKIKQRRIYYLSAIFVLSGLIFFGLTYKFPLCMLFLTGTVFIGAGILMEGRLFDTELQFCDENSKEGAANSKKKAANIRLAMTMGCCLCIAAVAYHLVRFLAAMRLEVLWNTLRGYILLSAIRDICFMAMLVSLIFSIHRGRGIFAGSFLTGSYFFLRQASGSWMMLGLLQPKMDLVLNALRRELFLLLYCIGIVLYFYWKHFRDVKLTGYNVGSEGQEESRTAKGQWQEEQKGNGSTGLKISGVIYIVLAIIGLGVSSHMTNQSYDAWSWIGACAVLDNLFYLFAGLYAFCYAKRPEKAKKCMILGWILLVGAVLMLTGGCILVVQSAWMFVEIVGKMIILPALLRIVLAIIYLKGGRNLWKKRKS